MLQLFANNAETTLAQPISSVDTTITIGSAAGFPTLSANTYYLLTLIEEGANALETGWEIVKVTAVAGNVLTVVRGQENTPARAWPYGVKVQLRVTADSLDGLRQWEFIRNKPNTLTGYGIVDATPASHLGNYSNPHSVSAFQLGLGNVNNTSDTDKPVSTAQAAALALKSDVGHTHNYEPANTNIQAHIASIANPHSVTAAQVGADPVGTSSAAITAHVAALDPHTQYTTTTEAAAAAPVQSVAGRTGAIVLTKADVGLGSVDNTTDLDKPISTATQTALVGKQPLDATLTALAGVVTAADRLVYASGVDTFATTPLTLAARSLLDDANVATMRTTLGAAATAHTHAIADTTGLQAALDAKLDDSQATASGLALLGATDVAAQRSSLGLANHQLLRVDGAGNFGIGVVPSAWGTNFAGSPQKALSIGSTNIYGHNGYEAGYVFNAYRLNDGSFKYQGYGGDAGAAMYKQYSIHSWHTAPSGTEGAAINFTQAMTLNQRGALLLGTTTDDGVNALQCAGRARVVDFESYRNDAGHVGSFKVGSNAGYGIKFCNAAYADSGAILIYESSVVYSTASDRRLKSNILPANDSGELLDAVQIVKHDWRAGGHASYGVIAQDLYQVFPEAAVAGDDGEEIERTWAVDYSKLVAPMLLEVQSLRRRVAALEAV